MIQWFDGADYLTHASWLSASGFSPYENVSGSTHVDVLPTDARTGLNGYGFFPSGDAPALIKSMTGNLTTLVAGCAMRMNGVGVQCINSGGIGFQDAGTFQMNLMWDNLGRLYFSKNTSTTPLVGPSTYQYPPNQFHYLEIQVTVDAVTGSCFCWVDGQLVLSGTGLNTRQTGNNWMNQFSFGLVRGTGSGHLSYDDIYVLDTTGPPPWNGRLGDCAVLCYVPTASGSFTQWTPFPPTTQNWQNVGLIGSKAYSFFNFTAATGNRDSYVYNAVVPASGGPIIAVMPMLLVETDAAGTRVIKGTARQAGTDFLSPPANVGAGGYVYTLGGGRDFIMETDVNGFNWIASNFQATEFGIELIS